MNFEHFVLFKDCSDTDFCINSSYFLYILSKLESFWKSDVMLFSCGLSPFRKAERGVRLWLTPWWPPWPRVSGVLPCSLHMPSEWHVLQQPSSQLSSSQLRSVGSRRILFFALMFSRTRVAFRGAWSEALHRFPSTAAPDSSPHLFLFFSRSRPEKI